MTDWNAETIMLRAAIEADDEWLEQVEKDCSWDVATGGDAIADTLEQRISMVGKGRHELKDLVLLLLAIGSTWRIDFDQLAEHFRVEA